ncbi:aspartate/glutamate racemase family protein [uncultured Desulfovibrio sp.]|uniref:aspartate/glutamate racemase family protein n=1 Tax=uncultured Desulfovibrio sp. TaxID=167968 RepID=UPI00263AD290|nr:amino acid racemase [uncultured Desulfovibrio sp.]
MRTCGILGGMGPEATIDLMRRIVAHTRAQDDADHVHCLVDNNPQVPSRIKVLLEGGTVSPGPCMAAMGRGLEAQGADFLCIACNTAHNWRDEVARAVNIPVLDMIALAAAEAARRAPKARAGSLASPAVRLTGLYEAPCRGQGLEPVFADEAEEARLLGVIRAIKAGRTGDDVRADLKRVVENVLNKGAGVLIAACTELGVIGVEAPVPVVDAADALAAAIVLEGAGPDALKRPGA